jgi:CRP-like cAMP-binding protein
MIDNQDRQKLEHAKLFANVSLESVTHLLESCHPLNMERGEHLLEPGAPNSHLYVILDGELRVYLSDRSLPEHAVFGPGDCVGEMSLLDGQAASALVLAAKDTRLVAVPHEILWAMVDCSHGVARNLLALMAGRMRNDNLALITSQNRSLEFEQAASVDALTGLHNRRWLMEAYPRAIARCDQDGQPVCLLIADIDHFKRFNDCFRCRRPSGRRCAASAARRRPARSALPCRRCRHRCRAPCRCRSSTPRQRVRAVADQRRALDRVGHLAVLDHVGLGAGEHELAAGDVDLTAAEIDGVQPFFTDAMISAGSRPPLSM